jgi:hypothetical protein
MKMTPWIVAAAVAIAGCGGGSTPEPATDLNPAFGGTWNGNTLLSVPNYPSSSIPGQRVVSASGRTATITRVCPDGTGTVVAAGSGHSVDWKGSLACPPVPVGNLCAAVTATLTSASGLLSADGTTLTVEAAGTASGCSLSSPVTLGFVGSK